MVGALERAGVEYLVVGSTAAAAWGVARMTRDVDVVALIGPDEVEDVLRALAGDDLYVNSGDARRSVVGGSFNVIHTSSGGKVDIFVSVPGDGFTQSRLSRRQPVEVLGIATWVATPEDVVLAKLRWRLQSRSETQWRDCVEIATVQSLDREYLHQWAPTLAVSQDLDELLAQVDHLA